MRRDVLLVCTVALAACRPPPPPEPAPVGSDPVAGDAGRVTAADGDAAADAPAHPSDPAAPQAASPDASVPACADSEDCTAGAICCERVRTIPRKLSPGDADPFGQAVDRETTRICTSAPEQECDSPEICAGASCRRRRPKVRLRCGSSFCTDPTPRCVLDITDVPEGRPPGSKRRPPKCVGGEAQAEGDASVLSCSSKDDCPQGTRCVLFHHTFSPTRFYARCVFKAHPDHGVEIAPLCRETAECAKLLEGFATSGGGKPSRCRPVRGTSSHVRACEVPGTSMF